MTDPRASPAGRRALAAAWFAAWGIAAAALVYLVPAADQGFPGFAYLVLIPGVAAGCAGAFVGPAVLDPARSGPLKSAVLGLATALLGHLVFGVLFAGTLWLEGPGSTGFPGLALATAFLGPIMVGLVTLPMGMLAGWLLFLVGRTMT